MLLMATPCPQKPGRHTLGSACVGWSFVALRDSLPTLACESGVCAHAFNGLCLRVTLRKGPCDGGGPAAVTTVVPRLIWANSPTCETTLKYEKHVRDM